MAGLRRHKTSPEESLQMTPGRSINAGMQQRSRSLSRHPQPQPQPQPQPRPHPQPLQGLTRALSDLDGLERPSDSHPFISNLPPAVANVPQDDVRSYVHSKRVTHYHIGSTLGEGSFAKVKEGFHVLVGEKVAVKVIDKKKAQQDPYVTKNFRREARLLQMIHHPNILQLLEVVETDNSYYLITELCSGGELMQHIYNRKQLEEKETRKYMRQMVSAVDHLHKAGIIHRDLKVENLLLDSAGNVKIIDFGLSNEEYVLEESGRVHCSTQCGSPAYAAPELLGHKPYGPEVDIWSLGVNMYAMLTGCLPYTVEPFNITALHAKMLENKMNPIPSSLSVECNDLLHGLLTSDPAQRIKMPALMAHPWMTADGSPALKPHPFPNKLTTNDINEDIVQHMVHVLKLKEDVTAELLTDRACATSAIYYLLLARLDRYNRQKPKIKVRKKSKYESHVNHVTSVENDDTYSMISCPPRTLKDHTPNRAHLRPVTRDSRLRKVPDECEGRGSGDSRLRQRRKTLPSELMKDDIERIRQQHNLPPVQGRTGMQPRTVGSRLDTTPHAYGGGGHEVAEVSRPSTHLNPVRPPPTGRTVPSSKSHPKDLNKLRQELSRHVGALSSQPPSQANSLAPSTTVSRQPSRQPSATSRQLLHDSTTHHRLSGSEYDIEFHEVDTPHVPIISPSKHSYGSHTQKRLPHITVESGSRDNIHFPSLTSQGGRDHVHHHQRSGSYSTTRDPHHTTTSKTLGRVNGHWSSREQYEFPTDSTTSGVLSQLHRVLESLSISCTAQKGHTLYLRCQSTKFQVHVDKDHRNMCQLQFQWLQGGSQELYEDLCSRIFSSLSV